MTRPPPRSIHLLSFVALAFALAFLLPVVAATCGNGAIEAGETCDDGNTTPDDGCAANCTAEPGWTCPHPNTRCLPNASTFAGRTTTTVAVLVLLVAIFALCCGCCMKWWGGGSGGAESRRAAANQRALQEALLENMEDLAGERDVADDYSSDDDNDDIRASLAMPSGTNLATGDDTDFSEYGIRDVEPELLEVGDHTVFRKAPVAIRFIGETEFGEGEWVGVELLKGKGKHDGRVQGRRYFSCDRPGKVALFCRRSALGLKRKKDKDRAAKRAAEHRPRSSHRATRHASRR
ncbi:uncharacterized protein AMSG_02511 [Thecamonas trahens ATCC 50062]|uniref:CAP-Gly domain-containing protein n=1 Tax=Thecamonas trahens ATCC 50062 TaxID=461836 RepID=A0A0L0D579_THETB|nr:hypothetical protein AMSG_02511 [Thecamonas trahens ATCC 50062]KNC47494.1 hypothetical protein AMSG_02511 [Thecamonas trahens ATCC 50062]|eukprot:XP_013759430.1 hypothetical protein AMSG_02511 [Thecamonas trahens ATCC 50062]